MACYDVGIIGAGTMGSATAYHLSHHLHHVSACLIGPGEAPESGSSPVYGCHYDEGRITRVISQIRTEQLLAYRGTLDYPALERESGIKVFWEQGCAVIGKSGDVFLEDYVKMADEFCKRQGLVCEKVDLPFIQAHWNYLKTVPDVAGRFALKHNGYISVRNLVAACCRVAEERGVARVRSLVTSIDKEGECFVVTSQGGRRVRCRKVVLACGSFSNFFNLVPGGRQLDLRLQGHTVMKYELTADDVTLLSSLPSTIYKPDHDVQYVYILPPIQYPDGKTYLKLGHTVYLELDVARLGQPLQTLQDVQGWYRRTDYPRAREYFNKHLQEIFPCVSPVREKLDFCVMAITGSGKQLIGFAEEGFLVACGGNGKSAKFGLEIGKICARSILKGEWDYDLDQQDFKLCFKDE